jgi:membrane protein implicated in regulation of membrane protease activity
MLSGGALAAALAAVAGAGVVGSSAVFAIVSVALIAFARPVAKRHLYQAPLDRTGTAALIGTEALVMEVVDGGSGRVKLAGEIWSARTLDETARFEPGEHVSVFEIDGATAVVG